MGGVDDRFAEGAEYGESYETNYSPRRKAQREAFLSDNYKDSLSAVRASNAAIGVERFGQKTYANDGGTLREISNEAYNKHRNEGLSAQELKDSFVTKIVKGDKGEEETTVPSAQSDITNMTPENKKLNSVLESIGASSKSDGGNPGVYETEAQATDFSMNNSLPSEASKRSEVMKTNYFNTNDDDED